jgi:hypothetical protein
MPESYDPTPDAVGCHWDALVRGERPPEGRLDPVLAEAIAWAVARDDAPRPDPRFVSRLEEQIMATLSTPGAVLPVPTKAPWTTWNGHAAPGRGHWSGQSETGSRRRALAPLATAALVVLTLVGSFFAFGPGRPGRSDDPPALVPAISGTPATPAGPAPSIETLVTTTFSAEALPTVSTPAFLIWYATIDPETEVAIPPDPIACCPGPQIAHVLAGELALRVEGPLRVLGTSPDGTAGPAEEVAPGTEIVLRAGDTAVYSFELPATYRNAGTESVQLVAGGVFAGSPPNPPVFYAIAAVEERYPAPVLPPGPMAATLHRATLAPDGIFPAPPSGSIQVVMTGPELGTLGERSDGSAQNIGREPVEVFALVLAPAGPEAGTPITPDSGTS